MREPSPETLIAIADAYPVPGIRLRYKRLRAPIMRKGWLLPKKNHLYPAHANLLKSDALLPWPETREKLYVHLHEKGHLLLKHFGRHWTRSPFKRTKYTRKNELPGHVEEYQAEMFAHREMRKHGIAVPRQMTRDAKRYICDWIDSDRKQGIKINRKIERWANSVFS